MTVNIQSIQNQTASLGAVKSLQGARDRLENRVQARTLELLSANQALQQENNSLQQEVKQHQRSQQVLLATKAQLKRLLAFSPVVIYSRNLGQNYNITFVSESIAQFGYEPHKLLADDGFWASHVHPDDAPQAFVDLVRLSQVGQQSCEYRLLQQDGSYCWIRDQRQVIYDENHTPVEIVGSWQDIGERKRMEQALAQEKELAQTTLQSIGDAVIATDAKGRVVYLNPAAVELTGWSLHEAQSQRLGDVLVTVHESTRIPVSPLMHLVLAKGHPDQNLDSILLLAKDGREYVIDQSTAPIRDRSGQITGTVVVFRDVTKPRLLSRQLSWQATHDPLTNLLNRQEFERRVSQAIESTQTDRQNHALCYLDLDQFKVVNDTCGHGAGDELLRQLSYLLQQALRSGDILARLGGDEFGLLLVGCPVDKALEIANKLLAMIQAFRFIWQDHVFKVGASIGLVMINTHREGHSGDVNQVLSAADVACYAAKNNGRNRVHVYEVDDREVTQQRCEQQWVSRITSALDQGRFQLYKQRIVPLSSQAGTPIEHAEILLRMVDEQGKLIPPMAFLPAAERYGLMTQLDQWVITHFLTHCQDESCQDESCQDESCQDESCQDQLGQPAPINSLDFPRSNNLGRYSINLSGASINDEQFLDFVKGAFATYPHLAHQVCFEITETIAIANLGKATQFMKELKHLGFQFALDDFGSGMSSFNYLKHLPVDYLKIDGSFVHNILSSPVDSAMVECINRLGHLVGIQTIAEYVDSQAILAQLRVLGVDYVQGYAIAHPSPL
jgi:diguanylate cyclase (GGDEF)-like protein/PAS domain S-box-containing protein